MLRKANRVFLFSLLMIVVIVLSMSTIADEGEWRIWFNDETVYLSGERPLIIDNAIIYLPSDFVLSRFGATYVYDSATETYTVFLNDLILAFNMGSNQVITSDGRFIYAKVLYENRVFYLPANFILSEFGGELSVLASGSLRITTGRQRLRDIEVEAVEASMLTSNQGETSNDKMYILIRALPSQVINHIRLLSTRNVRAAFFFSLPDIESSPSSLREVYVSGNTIGIYVRPDSVESAIETIKRIQFLMERVVKTSTNIVLAPGGSAAFYRELENQGYIVWDTNFDSAVEANGASLPAVAGRIRWESAVYFDGSADSVNRLTRLIDGMANSRQRFDYVAEGRSPVRYGG